MAHEIRELLLEWSIVNKHPRDESVRRVETTSFVGVPPLKLVSKASIITIHRSIADARRAQAIAPFALPTLQGQLLHAIDEPEMPVHVRIDGNGTSFNSIQ